MSVKKILPGLLLLVVLVMASVPLLTYAQPSQPEKPNFVFVNYVGSALVLDLDDVTYTVPAATTSAGGRLELQLAAGEHKYAANVPGVKNGSAGIFTLSAGGYVGKAARLEKTEAVLDKAGNVLAEPEDKVLVFDVDPFATPVAAAPVADAWVPAPAGAGQGSLVWANYNGDELTVDIGGTVYKVPPAANTIPGRLQISVAPGLVRYTASVPGGSLNGEATLAAGQVVGLNVSAKLKKEADYEVGKPAPTPEPVELLLSVEDLTAQTAAGTTTPAVEATPTAPAPAVPPASTGGKPGLLVKNFTGQTLTFTVNNQVWAVPDNAETAIPLADGSYNYTASLPFAAVNGTVNLAPGQSATLSVAATLAHDRLSVYQQ